MAAAASTEQQMIKINNLSTGSILQIPKSVIGISNLLSSMITSDDVDEITIDIADEELFVYCIKWMILQTIYPAVYPVMVPPNMKKSEFDPAIHQYQQLYYEYGNHMSNYVLVKSDAPYVSEISLQGVTPLTFPTNRHHIEFFYWKSPDERRYMPFFFRLIDMASHLGIDMLTRFAQGLASGWLLNKRLDIIEEGLINMPGGEEYIRNHWNRPITIPIRRQQIRPATVSAAAAAGAGAEEHKGPETPAPIQMETITFRQYMCHTKFVANPSEDPALQWEANVDEFKPATTYSDENVYVSRGTIQTSVEPNGWEVYEIPAELMAKKRV